jgi:hypothetical protein
MVGFTPVAYWTPHHRGVLLDYTLSIQRELPWNNLLTVGYQGTRGVHLLAFHDFNSPHQR